MSASQSLRRRSNASTVSRRSSLLSAVSGMTGLAIGTLSSLSYQDLSQMARDAASTARSVKRKVESISGGTPRGPFQSGPLDFSPSGRKYTPAQKKAKWGVSTGYYRGRVKARRVKRGRVKGFKKEKVKYLYQKHGWFQNVETHGKIDDPDCVFVGQSTYEIDTLANVITIALLRKLFQKAGFTFDTPDYVIPVNTLEETVPPGALIKQSFGCTLQWVRYNNTSLTGGQSFHSYNLADNETLQTIASTATLKTQIADALYNFDGNNRSQFEKIALYARASTNLTGGATEEVATSRRLIAQLNLKEEIVKYYSTSTIHIQNRTKSAEGGSTDTTTIDNQPLKGYLFEFKSGLPDSKIYRDPLTKSTVGGLILTRGAQLGPKFREPMVKEYFNNVSKIGKIRLNPGDIKHYTISFKKSAFFNDFIDKMVSRSNPNVLVPSGVMAKAPGRCQLMALEETLNSGSTNKITVNYEAEKGIGVFFKTSRKKFMIMGHEDKEINNITP